MSNLLPYNLNNSKLKDDNFESTINHNPHLENYNNKSDIYENYTNNNEKDVLIEKFSNHNSSCPLMSGDEVIIEHGTNEDEHLIDIDNKKFAKKRKYLTKFKINEGEKDKIIKYGDSISLTKSGKKKHKIHSYYVKYKQKNQIDINNNIVTAMKSPNLKLTYEFTVVTTIWQRERSNDWVRLIGKGNSKKRNYGLWVHPDGRSLSQIYGVNSGINVWPNTPVIPLKKWTHLATTFKKNGEHKFYFNGNLFQSLPTTGTPFTDEEPLTLGGANFHTTFNGLIKDSYVFNKVLNDEEIKSLSSHSIVEKNFKISTDSNHQKGDIVFYNDRIQLNKLGKILFTRPLGVPCSMKVPKTITGIDLNYKIKQIKVRCDDFFEMYIDGVTYKGSGWNKTFTFNNPIIKNPKGYIIGFKCTNGGGPGALIAQFEFENGSFMVTDNSWLGCNYIHNENLFKTNPTNYYHEKDSWKGVNVIGLNQNNKLKWDGRKIPSWDRWFVDSNFSQFANYIWAGKCLDAGSVYLKKSIGTMPWGESCSNKMTTAQAMCYLERYPSLKQQAIKALSTNYRYEFNSTNMSWNAHQNEARRRGGNLVCIHNKKVSDYITRNFLHRCPGGWGHWIGAFRTNNKSYDRSSRSWRWIDGSSWTYENFLRKHYEPNNWREDKAHTWKHNVYGSWNDLPGSYKLPGVYQIKINENVDMNKIIEWAKRHWKNIGCKTNLTYSCLKPPATIGMYDYEGCYYEDYKKENIPNFRGKVTSLNQCQEKATANRDIVFGVTNFGDCYTGNDINKVRRQSFSENCPSLGKDGSIQVYNRRRPFDPLDPELSKKNFSEKFTNKKNELEDPKLSKNNFSEKFQNNKKILSIVFILIIICLILYLCLTK